VWAAIQPGTRLDRADPNHADLAAAGSSDVESSTLDSLPQSGLSRNSRPLWRWLPRHRRLGHRTRGQPRPSSRSHKPRFTRRTLATRGVDGRVWVGCRWSRAPGSGDSRDSPLRVGLGWNRSHSGHGGWSSPRSRSHHAAWCGRRGTRSPEETARPCFPGSGVGPAWSASPPAQSLPPADVDSPQGLSIAASVGADVTLASELAGPLDPVALPAPPSFPSRHVACTPT